MENRRIDTFGNRLYTAMQTRKLNQTELSEQTKKYDKVISQSLINKYIKGKAFARQNNLYTLAQILDVSEAWLMGYDVPMERQEVKDSTNKTRKIPVVDKITTDFNICSLDNVIGYEVIDETLPPNNKYFCLKITDNSMEPRICKGDIVIIKIEKNIGNGEYAVVRVADEEATIKRVMQDNRGITLIPLNNAYLPKFYTLKEVKELPVEIIGKIVELRIRL